MSKAKQKGTSAETALVKYLQANGFSMAERRALNGSTDLGDITGTPCLAWEVKNHKTYSIPEWLRQTQIETENAKADFGVLAVKPNKVGLASAGQWWAIMTMEQMVRLLREAGYGDKND